MGGLGVGGRKVIKSGGKAASSAQKSSRRRDTICGNRHSSVVFPLQGLGPRANVQRYRVESAGSGGGGV